MLNKATKFQKVIKKVFLGGNVESEGLARLLQDEMTLVSLHKLLLLTTFSSY